MSTFKQPKHMEIAANERAESDFKFQDKHKIARKILLVKLLRRKWVW